MVCHVTLSFATSQRASRGVCYVVVQDSQQGQHLLSAILAPFDVFSIDHAVLEIYGRVRTVLKHSCTAVGAWDTFIATQALGLGATLVTSNTKEFARMPGLQIED
jgi:tRNA(fMet)-specific endonuclease VapC